jgi:hypothetical protein
MVKILKKILVRQIRRHQFQFHQILQKDLVEIRIKNLYIFCTLLKHSAEVRSQLYLALDLNYITKNRI